MGCTQSNFHGKCNYFDVDEPDCRPEGCDEKGNCDADGDPDPSWCGNYESDWLCGECGQDCNVEECDCQ